MFWSRLLVLVDLNLTLHRVDERLPLKRLAMTWPGRVDPTSSLFQVQLDMKTCMQYIEITITYYDWNLPPDAKPCSTCPLNFVYVYCICMCIWYGAMEKKNSLASRLNQSVCEHPANLRYLRAHVKFTSHAQRCSSFWVAKPSMLKLLYPHVRWVTMFWWCLNPSVISRCQETQGDAVARDLEPGGVFSHKLL